MFSAAMNKDLFNEPEQVSDKPKLYMPKDSLDTNKISGSYIVSIFIKIRRFEMIEVERDGVTKIYRYKARHYVVPQRGKEPPDGYSWEKIGRMYNRDIFKA